MNEIWRDIKDYEGLYQVSNLGRVRSLYFKKQRILKLKTNNFGYLAINLYKKGFCKTFRIHRLVATAFIPNPNNYPIINHKDENRVNNKVENLEWCTIKYNNNYGSKNIKTRDKLKKTIGCFKNGKLIKQYDAIIDVAKDGFNYGDVGCCLTGRHKTHWGYTWRYLEDEN